MNKLQNLTAHQWCCLKGSTSGTRLTKIKIWISNYTRSFIWGMITHPCHNINGSLTHWGRTTHICVGKLTIIGSDNGLSPGRRQAIIWTSAGILLIGPLGTNFSEILIGIQIFSFKKIHVKMSSGKRRPFCLGLNVLTKPPLKLEHGWVITSHCFTWMWLLIHNCTYYGPYPLLWFGTGQFCLYLQTSSIRRITSQNLNVFRLVLQLSLCNLLRMEM